MQDRVSLYPGRVKLTPVAGQENTFDLVRADQPTQEGTPLNKMSILTDKTAALFGFDQTAVPNDIFDMLSYLIPTEKGLLTVQTVDQNGTPVKKSISVSPSINGSGVIETNTAGLFRTAVPAGTYTFSAGRSGDFEMISPETSAAEIKIGEATHVGFQFSQKTSGEIDITESKTIDIPEWLTAIDLFVVGGGGSGAAGGATRASGGGGGYTKTLKNQNLAGKSLSIKIGAGGAAVTHNRAGSGHHGNAGGSTSISADGAEILSASGGYAGYYFDNGDSSSFRPNGGSGGGGGWTAPEGGSDGGNGSGDRGGTGQGSTTRKFGESSNTLYSGGGGGAASNGTSTGAASASGGSGGGGSGVALWGASATGGNATFYGGGGGAAVAYASYVSSSGYTTVSGNGYQGLASIRWNLGG